MNGPASTGASRSGWHVDQTSLRRWVDGLAGPIAGASVEQHVLHCAQCQSDVAALVPVEPLRPVWDNVLAEVESPRPGPAQRLLVKLGLSASDAIVVASAVTLRVAWLVGMVAVLAFTVFAAVFAEAGGIALFLMAAPLIPIAGVAAAYGPTADPSYEAVLAAPYAMVRLVLLRTASVLATSVPVVVVSGLLLPTSWAVAIAWLLPAAGFVVVVLTASNWVDPAYAASVVATGWVVAVAFAARAGDPLVLLSPPALVGYLAAVLVAGAVLLDRLVGETPSWRLR